MTVSLFVYTGAVDASLFVSDWKHGPWYSSTMPELGHFNVDILMQTFLQEINLTTNDNLTKTVFTSGALTKVQELLPEASRESCQTGHSQNGTIRNRS